MKRAILTALIAACVLGGLAIGGPLSNAQEAQQRESRRDRQCRFQYVDRGTWTTQEERLTAECVVAKYPVPGGLSTLLSIGSCESGWDRFAWNPNGHAGLFQHDIGAWAGRVQTWEPYWWTLRPRWTNSRSQIVVTARMARSDGDWHQWAGCT